MNLINNYEKVFQKVIVMTRSQKSFAIATADNNRKSPAITAEQQIAARSQKSFVAVAGNNRKSPATIADADKQQIAARSQKPFVTTSAEQQIAARSPKPFAAGAEKPSAALTSKEFIVARKPPSLFAVVVLENPSSTTSAKLIKSVSSPIKPATIVDKLSADSDAGAVVLRRFDRLQQK